ncbi:hypothetical protein BAE44_0012699 [Dichanthelium oligosanthes]|uniref:Uncharacterized protein n=1 Tax=Dichanthelium oligosanthes TaxID=888268 RepID=A0A1E5VMI0_9POAL|nr:hypothetical protein BAE44_0012699 [Dichanthelium oligosanthes]
MSPLASREVVISISFKGGRHIRPLSVGWSTDEGQQANNGTEQLRGAAQGATATA